jgi:hypothetical protein
MTWLQWLQALASLGSVVTAAVAALAYGRYLYERRQKRLRLERHLKTQKAGSKGGDRGQRSIVDTMVALGMTEADVLDAAFRSRRIKRSQGLVPSGAPPRIDLEYAGPNSN